MNENKSKIPKKGAGKRLRELYERNRAKSKASEAFINGFFKDPVKDRDKKSAKDPDVEA